MPQPKPLEEALNGGAWLGMKPCTGAQLAWGPECRTKRLECSGPRPKPGVVRAAPKTAWCSVGHSADCASLSRCGGSQLDSEPTDREPSLYSLSMKCRQETKKEALAPPCCISPHREALNQRSMARSVCGGVVSLPRSTK